MSENTLTLIYDGECPFCRRYADYVRLREAVGQPRLVDAREGGALVRQVQDMGYDLNEGMVVIYQGDYYHGAQALQFLADKAAPAGIFNRLNHALFSGGRMARWSYPLLRAGRNLALRVKNIGPINKSG